ncbi:MAG: hypothetical protein AB1847_12685 [bacterium]
MSNFRALSTLGQNALAVIENGVGISRTSFFMTAHGAFLPTKRGVDHP